MNYRMLANVIAKIVCAEALFMLPALCISVYNEERSSVIALVITVAIMLVLGLPIGLKTPKRRDMRAREGLVCVGLCWIVVSLFGALPFFISGAIPNYIDCVFETVSGFTTTGSSILTDVEALPRGLLYWRSFTHWLGGMGVLVFMMAIGPLTEKDGGESIHLLRAESPGIKITKLVPRMKRSAEILYAIYVVLTLIMVILMLVGGAPLFDSVTITFGTAGTGGFGIKNDSLASYSPYIQWVVTVFMLLFSVNFNIYFFILLRRFRRAAKDEELRWFILVVLISVAVVMVDTRAYFASFGESLRHCAFTVASIISTSGFVTVDFDLWPQISRTLLVLIMFIGACAGSTGGGSKVVRFAVLLKSARRAVHRAINPRAVKMVHLDGDRLEEDTVTAVANYYLLYFLTIAAATMLITVDGFNMETNFTAVVTCVNNVGPGMDMVGATGNFSAFSGFSKIVLSAAMLIGRLEIYPILVILCPGAWKK